ncbi:SMP-30/gluconolactonase/LRE family protein [bacterium]|nr:SMP-30/gluconolactonase/LRE family protein [bacterium]
MRGKLVKCAALLLVAVLATGCQQGIKQAQVGFEMPEQYNTPDGMALDQQGNIILSMPNFNDNTYPAKMMRITPDDKMEEIITLPVHPETKKVGPLGVDVAPNGDLYVADCQALAGDDNHKSRILRVVMKDGKAVRVEVVATGFVMSNAIVCHGDSVYMTESNLFSGAEVKALGDKAGLMRSGVYRFKIAELDAKKPYTALPGGKDPHLVVTFETKNPDWVGANGMGFAADGSMYVCNFGDAQLLKFAFDKAGKVAAKTVVAEGQGMLCADGMKVHPKTGDVYIADFLGNAVHVIDVKTGKLTILAKNWNNTGAKGKLDRPSEVCIRGDKCYVANIDLPLAGNKYDVPHSISVIDLSDDKK